MNHGRYLALITHHDSYVDTFSIIKTKIPRFSDVPWDLGIIISMIYK